MLTKIKLKLDEKYTFDIYARYTDRDDKLATVFDPAVAVVGTASGNMYTSPPDIVQRTPPTLYVPPSTPGGAPGARVRGTYHTTVDLAWETSAVFEFKAYPQSFVLKVNGKEVDPAAGMQWSLDGVVLPPPAAGGGTPVPPKIDSKNGKISLGDTGTKAKIKVQVTGNFVLIWSSSWPQLDDKHIAWRSDQDGRLAVGAIYYLLKNMPQSYISKLNICRYERVPKAKMPDYLQDTSYFFPFFVAFNNEAEVVNVSNTSAPDELRRFIYTAVHESAHLAMATMCLHTLILTGVEVVVLVGSLIAIIVATVGMVIATGVAGIVAIPFNITLFLMGVDGALGRIANIVDVMTQFSKTTSWECHGYHTHVIPLLGWLTGLIFRMNPNYILTSTGNNPCLKNILGLGNKDLDTNKGDWRKAGFCSEYATHNPQEDFAESLTAKAVENGIFDLNRGTMPVSGTRDAFLNQHFFNASWKQMTFSDIENGAERYSDVEIIPEREAAGIETLEGKEDDLQATIKKLEPELLKLHDAWMQLKEVYTPELQEAVMSTKSIIQSLDTEIKEERPVVFARTLELYEEGLSKWDKAGQVAAGDVLLDRDAKVWLIAKADAEGRIKHIIGDVKYDKDDEMMGMKYEEDKLLYHWKPGKKPRKWLQDGQQYSRGIKAEGDEVMKQLVMLWGERKGKENDEDLGRFPGFFREFLRIAGIQDPEYHFNDELDLQAVINFCQTHGEGLIDYTTAVLIEPGDVLIPFHENTIWVVTRATADGKPLDVVAGGNYKPGYLGEKAGDVQMHHNIDTDDIKQYWKPNSSPRDWNH